MTTISTRYACVENENMWSRVLCFGSHEMCVLNWHVIGVDDENLEGVPRKHVRVLVHMNNHTGALRLQSQHTSNWKSFYTSWYVLLIQAKN